MQDFFDSGRAADLVIAVLLAEAAWTAFAARRRTAPAPWGRLLHLASGLSLAVALRVALTGGAWPGVAAAMSAGFVFHLGERLIGRARA